MRVWVHVCVNVCVDTDLYTVSMSLPRVGSMRG